MNDVPGIIRRSSIPEVIRSLTEVSGDLTIQSNTPACVLDLGSLTTYGCGTNEVTMTLNGATVEMTNGLTICTNATLTGSTTVDGSVTNNGTIEPGSSPGRLNITRNLALGSASRLRMEIGGYASSVRLTWSAIGGKTYRVQTNGTLLGGFNDNGTAVTAPGTTEFITNILNPDAITNSSARYYRLRLGP